MTARSHPPLQHPVTMVPGGCHACRAYRVIQAEGGLMVIHLYHQPGCPVLAAIRREQAAAS
jgi:hypothetical protein